MAASVRPVTPTFAVVAENAAITSQNLSFGQLNFSAKKIACRAPGFMLAIPRRMDKRTQFGWHGQEDPQLRVNRDDAG